MIVERVTESKRKKINQWPVTSNRASEAGHPCVRYLVYQRTRWEEKELHDVGLQYIFDEGNRQEKAVMEDLQEAGFTLIEQQRSFQWREHNITGHVDCKLIEGDEAIPTEIKSCSPYIFDSLHTLDDLFTGLNGKYLHLMKYPAQLTLYMLMDNKERGVFIFKNKTNGQLKEIWMDLDYNYAESIIQNIETVNLAVDAGVVPERIPWIEKICGDCPFAHICLPEAVRAELEIVDDPEYVKMIERRIEIAPMQSEYKNLTDALKKGMGESTKRVVGDYIVYTEPRFKITNIEKLRGRAGL